MMILGSKWGEKERWIDEKSGMESVERVYDS